MARFEWTEHGLRVTVPANRRAEVLELIETACGRPRISRKAVRVLAGKISALAGIIPYLAAFNRSLHKVGHEDGGAGMAFTK